MPNRIPWDRQLINEANRKLIKLIRDIIKTKSRDHDGHKIIKRTGNLKKNVKPLFFVKGTTLHFDIQVMEYYQYLDAGTGRIQPWFLNEEIENELEDILEDLLVEGIEGAIFKSISDITFD